MERFSILQVLDEKRNSVVVSELVEDVGTVERGGLFAEWWYCRGQGLT